MPVGFVEKLQFRRSNTFDQVAAEILAVRERAGIMDLSSFSKFDVAGPGAMLDRLCANRLPKKPAGIGLPQVCLGQGPQPWQMDDLPPSAATFPYPYRGRGRNAGARRLTFAAGSDVTISNVTDATGMPVVAGPRSREVLAGLTDTDMSNAGFRWLSAQEITLAGIPVRALRVTYVGELGWELPAPIADLARLYAAISAAGQPHGIADFGVQAFNSLRMEKGHRGYGLELMDGRTKEITLIEADCTRLYAPDKGDFRGRTATGSVREESVTSTLVFGEIATKDCDIYGVEARCRTPRWSASAPRAATATRPSKAWSLPMCS